MTKLTKLFALIAIAFAAITISACGGGAKDGGTNDIACNLPFVPLITGGCGCPSGTHQVGNSCESDPPPPVTVADPTNLVTSNVTTTTVDLAWNDNSNNEDGFAVYVSSTSSTSGYIQLVPANAANQHTRTVTGLAPSTHYWMKVLAFKSGAPDSGFTNVVSVTTLTPAVDPCTTWRSDLDPSGTGRPVKNVSTNYGPQDGLLHLVNVNGTCWVRLTDATNTGMWAFCPIAQFQYTAPAVVDGYWVMPVGAEYPGEYTHGNFK